MKVVLGTFARSSIETQLGADVAAGVQAALLHYSRRLASARAPVGFPRSCRGLLLDCSGATFELPIDAETRATLEREAARQEATAEQMLVHAVLVYLADLDVAAEPGEPVDAAPR
jgi:hypothetical protein